MTHTQHSNYGPYHQPQPPADSQPKSGIWQIVIPVVVGITALLVGVGVGNDSSQNTEPAPTVTATATVTEEAEAAIPQECLDGFDAADRALGSAYRVNQATAQHLMDDAALFENLTEAQVMIYLESMDEFTSLIEAETPVMQQAIEDLETARAGCK